MLVDTLSHPSLHYGRCRASYYTIQVSSDPRGLPAALRPSAREPLTPPGRLVRTSHRSRNRPANGLRTRSRTTILVDEVPSPVVWHIRYIIFNDPKGQTTIYAHPQRCWMAVTVSSSKEIAPLSCSESDNYGCLHLFDSFCLARCC